MTILHNKKQHVSLEGKVSESHNCVDCGFNTAPGLPPRELAEFLMNRDGEFPPGVINSDFEVYTVRNKVWKAAGMEPFGGCLCIGCLEKRLGRKLRPKDFPRDHPFNSWPGTRRLIERRGG